MKWVGLVIGALVVAICIATVFSGSAPRVFGQRLPSKASETRSVDPERLAIFDAFLAGRFDDLPRRVDERITLSSIAVQNDGLTFLFQLHDPNRASSIVALSGLEPAISTRLCTDPRFLAFAELKAKAMFQVDDIAGLTIERFTIDPSEC